MTSMTSKADFFIEANHLAALDKTHFSPSKRYELVVETYRTGTGTWEYSQGIVYRHETFPGAVTRTMLSIVQRNYPLFPFAWAEGHPDGHDYLICGRSYQGQTILRLDALPGAAAEIDILPAEVAQGNGFCWANITPSPDKLTLAVEGCIWGGPYDVRFYDFSAPFTTPYAVLGEIEVLSETFAAGWVDNDTYELQDSDIRHPDYDDEMDDGTQIPQRLRRWRRGASEEEVIPLPKDHWRAFPEEDA